MRPHRQVFEEMKKSDDDLIESIRLLYQTGSELTKGDCPQLSIDVIAFELSKVDEKKYPLDQMGDVAELYDTIV